MRKNPHVVIEFRFVGSGVQIDMRDFTMATRDGNGVISRSERMDFAADEGKSICGRADDIQNVVLQALVKSITGS